MLKLFSYLLCLILLNSCYKNQFYYKVNSNWDFTLNDTNYHITYTEHTDEFLIIVVLIDNYNDNYPLYLLDNDKIDYIVCNDVKYTNSKNQPRFGEISITENELVIKCIFANSGSNKLRKLEVETRFSGCLFPSIKYGHFIILKIK